jgi:hypothetical protein
MSWWKLDLVNVVSVSLKRGLFLNQLSDHQLLKKGLLRGLILYLLRYCVDDRYVQGFFLSTAATGPADRQSLSARSILMLFSHVQLHIPNGCFSIRIHTEILHAFLFSLF